MRGNTWVFQKVPFTPLPPGVASECPRHLLGTGCIWGGGLPHSRANSKPAPRSDALPAGKVTCTVGGFTALPAPPCGALLHGVHVFWIRV